MVKENLGVFQIERHQVDDESYNGEIVGVSEIYETKDFNGQPVEKLHIDINVKDGINLPFYLAAVVSDAGENTSRYRNSKLYDLLKAADVFDRYQNVRKKIFASDSAVHQNRALHEFLRSVLMGKKVKVITKTIEPENGESYSVVDTIVQFLDAPIKEEKVMPEVAKAV